MQAFQLVPLRFETLRRVALAFPRYVWQSSGDSIWEFMLRFSFSQKNEQLQMHKKHSKVQFRRRTKTKRVAWSGPHATWLASEARIVWQAVVPVLFSTICNLCFGCENYSWLRIFFTVSIDSPSVVPMIFRGRWDSDPLLSLLWQRCPACMAEGSHLPSDCRQEDKTILNCFGSMLVCPMVFQVEVVVVVLLLLLFSSYLFITIAAFAHQVRMVSASWRAPAVCDASPTSVTFTLRHRRDVLG